MTPTPNPQPSQDYEPTPSQLKHIPEIAKSHQEIEQTLGKALGYPWFKDDQENFPGATEKDGVCVGEHVAESIAAEAASKIEKLTTQVNDLLDNGRKLLDENEKLTQRIDTLDDIDKMKEATIVNLHQQIQTLTNRIRELEAEVERLTGSNIMSQVRKELGSDLHDR